MSEDLTSSPAWFAWYHLGLDLYPWQVEALESIGRGVRNGLPATSLVAANGSGKTQRVIAPAILWFLWRHPRGWCPITSGSCLQVEKQLFPALHAFRSHPLFRGWTFQQMEVRTPQGGQAIGFSTDSPGRAEGWHPKLAADIDPVFYVTDEAKSIPDEIFEAISRCTLSYQLLASSPGAPRGKFYRSHHEERADHHCITATSADCPHISPEKIERDRRLYGPDHPVFRSMHLAEFTESSERLLLTPAALSEALRSQPPADESAGDTAAFCDFAAGGDENVLAVRRGNSARIIHHWREKDTMRAVRTFAALFAREGLRADQIWGDADGLGTVMIDALAETGWRIHRFHGGRRPIGPGDYYANRISETWITGCREIGRGRVHLGTIDPALFRQLTTRRTEWADNGRLRIEPKDSLRASGLPSPDLADALLGAIACGPHLAGGLTPGQIATTRLHTNPFAVPLLRW